MQSNFGRVALGAVVVIVAVVLLIVLKDDDGGNTTSGGDATTTTEQAGSKASGEKPSKPTVPTIVVKNGKPVGGIEELTYDAGERVRFEVESNAADEVHVHGYDIEEEVAPGRPAVFDFPASIEGVFEGELHGSGEQIVELRVEP
jgi:hypothetical protein